MKRASVFVAACLGLPILGGCRAWPDAHDVIYQTSTINALLEGVYDGEVTVAELRRRGDLGLGTFNGLDGEMVVLDGQAWQIKSDGKVHRAADSMKTPFAAVTVFRADRTGILTGVDSLAGLTRLLEGLVEMENLPWAVRVRGTFRHVRTRSVPKQRRPYPKLVEVAKTQPTFEFRNVPGTLVGFRLPAYVAGVNVPGWHLHFIDDRHIVGGHLLDCRIDQATVEIDVSSAIHLALPTGGDFLKADLSGGRRDELRKAEK